MDDDMGYPTGEATDSSGGRTPIVPELVVLVTSVSRGIIGGIINYVEPLERGLPKKGISVKTFSYPRTLNLMESRGFPRVLRMPVHLVFVLWWILHIPRFRRHYERILVHSHGASYVLFASFLAKATGVSAIHTFHSPIHTSSRILRRLSPRLDALVFVSKNLHDLVRREAGATNSVIRYIPGSVNISRFRPLNETDRTAARQEALARWGLRDRGHLVLFLGRIVREKGVLEFVEAIGHLRKLGRPISAIVAGPLPEFRSPHSYVQMVRRRTQELGLENWLAFIGPVFGEEKERLMAAADVFVCSSLWEASGLSVVEALSSGVPVVASNIGGITERILQGHNGFLVDPSDPKDVATSIDRIVRSPRLREEMGARARLDALEKYSEEAFLGKYIALYDEIFRIRESGRARH